MNPIVLDRTRIEQYGNCPQQGYLSMLFDAVKAKAEGKQVFQWEKERLADADPKLTAQMGKTALLSTEGKLGIIGQQIHELIKEAFAACNNDLSKIPDWFAENLPKIRPDIQPAAIRHARHVCDMLADYHVSLLGVEQQVSITLLPETKNRPAVIVTMRYDLIGSGIGNLHIADWKTGYLHRTNSETYDSLQAQLGAWLLWQQPEYKEITKIHFWYYETLWGTKAYAGFDRDLEHPRIPHLTTQAAITGRIKEAVRMFLENRKDCWPTEQKCCWCEMIRFCALANVEAKTIANNSAMFIDKLVVDAALVKRNKKAATEWIKAKGPLHGSKVILARKKPTERFTAEFQDAEKAKGPAKTGDESIDSHFK